MLAVCQGHALYPEDGEEERRRRRGGGGELRVHAQPAPCQQMGRYRMGSWGTELQGVKVGFCLECMFYIMDISFFFFSFFFLLTCVALKLRL